MYPEFSMCLYGEGYGAKIQKGGGNYIPNGVDFALFDVLIDGWWLKMYDVEEIASKLSIKTVPFIRYGTLNDAVDMVSDKANCSVFGLFQAEGLVVKPIIPLETRKGHRIIGKIKYKDFH